MKTMLSLMSLFLFSSLHAEEAPYSPAKDQNLLQTVMMIVIALAFFYFILWRPEQKRRKALEEQRSHLRSGDKVVAMGILGEVVKINDQTVILKMVDGGQIEVLKGAITEVITP